MSPQTDRYAARGASHAKEDVHAAIAHLDRGLYPGAFCQILPDLLTADPNYCIAQHADGAGTKSALAWAYWRHTGDLSVWHGIAQDAIVMNTDDLLCVGATGPMLLSSTIGRNKRLVPAEVIAALIQGTELVLENLRNWGLDIHLTGGETADLGDLVRTVVVDSTVTTRFPRAQVIDLANLKPGLVIVGLASAGHTAWESRYNAGIGSNGLTSARHDLFSKAVATAWPESFDPALDPEVAYTGPFSLTDTHPELPLDLGQAVLSPTRTYAPILIPFLQEHRARIAGIVHCSGGGQTKILHFVPKGRLTVVKDALLPVPPLFRLIQQASGTPERHMFEVFNMGHRLEVYTDLPTAEALIAEAARLQLDAAIIGHTEGPGPDRLRILHNGQTHAWA